MTCKLMLFSVCIVFILLLTGCNTSSTTTINEDPPEQKASNTVKEDEPNEVEKEEVTTIPQEDWSAEKTIGVIENNYRQLSKILTVHQTEYFKKANSNVPYQDFIDMEQIKEELSVIGSPEWLDSGDVENWVDAYLCECDAYGNIRPYPLDMRFQIEEQDDEFITVSSIDLQNEMGYGGGTWSIRLEKKEGKFHHITYTNSDEYPLHLTSEEVIDYYQAGFQASLTFIEEIEMEGSPFFIFRGDNFHYAINPLTSVHDWQVAALYNEPAPIEEESANDFSEHTVASAESIALDPNDPSTPQPTSPLPHHKA